MTDLTEQWKKGELPDGWYWCKCYNEETKLLYCDGDCFELDDPETKNYYFFLPKDVAEITILAPVPSCEENQQLRALLKKYKKQLSEIKNAYIDLTTQDEYGSYYIDEAKLFVEIVEKTIKDYDEPKTTNAIGEKK